ncbi:uncharacterized protein LOC131854892 [Achroia grisella]|uniref:uncharacterized protein LOC131854892 n=1 Tax=Achroia grisella TaxID=688607 RepID=UPI0027D323D0|nr:uncharacterized protein LOC131854892 [Achroia grisella]
MSSNKMAVSLKKSHPEKYLLRLICRYLYYLGCGEFWYEPTIRSIYERVIYAIWFIITNTYLYGFVINECLGHLRTNLTVKEKNDLYQFSCAHPSISLKYLILYKRRDKIKYITKRVLEDTRTFFSSPELDRASLRKAILYCSVLIMTTYVTYTLSEVESIIAHFKEGTPIRTEVTLFPRSTDTMATKIFRFFIEMHWGYFITIMILTDCLCYCSLVFMSFRFKLLQLYFEKLRDNFLTNPENKSHNELEEEFKQSFTVGMNLHEDLLKCAREVQETLGAIYSVQILESMSLIVMCLIKLVHAERNLVFLLADLGYISVMTTLTGAYMMISGDITHEAYELSTSIFHSGWDLSRNRDIRPLVVVAIQRSQVPVYMTGLGVITLSYANFISVMRSSYSFFAVMY